jgi:hypothetical protein
MTPEEFSALNEKHPYLTYLTFDAEDIIGIVQNSDAKLISIYVYNYITEPDAKKRYLDLGRLWWEDSNHLIPINIFLRIEFKQFKFSLRCFPKKDVNDIMGPVLNLEESFQKRIKRRKIQLIKPMS